MECDYNEVFDFMSIVKSQTKRGCHVIDHCNLSVKNDKDAANDDQIRTLLDSTKKAYPDLLTNPKYIRTETLPIRTLEV